jgi:hypothetical protein
LIALRQVEPALRSRILQPVGATPGKAVFAFRRPGDAPDNGMLAVLNFSSEPVTPTLFADSATTEAFGERPSSICYPGNDSIWTVHRRL